MGTQAPSRQNRNRMNETILACVFTAGINVTLALFLATTYVMNHARRCAARSPSDCSSSPPSSCSTTGSRCTTSSHEEAPVSQDDLLLLAENLLQTGALGMLAYATWR